MSSSTPISGGGGGGFCSGEEPIQLIHSKSGKNVYRHDKYGYKVLMCPEEEQPGGAAAAAAPVSEEQILKLVREQTISRYLPHGCKKRRVMDVNGFRGNPALYFEWVEGISLKEWLAGRHQQRTKQGVTEEQLKVAMAITKSLDEFHYGGVACNFLTLEHIILQWTGNDNDGQCCIASLINLSRAVVFADVSEKDAKEAMRKDLNELGLILSALFSAESDVSSDVERRLSDDDEVFDLDEAKNDECYHQPSFKKRGRQRTLGDGLPTYLLSIISALVDDESADPSVLYDNASDVLKDLQVAAKKPELCLIPDARGRDTRSLILPKAFYGRQTEVSLLTRSLQAVAILGKPNVAVISGRSGAG